jgi:hypothetical protein
MFDIVKGALSASPLKLVLILAILTLASTVVFKYDKARFEAGYSAAEAKYLKEYNIATAAAEEAQRGVLTGLKGELEEETNRADKHRDKAVGLQKTLDDRPVIEVVREIDKIVTDCSDLGDDYKRVFHSIIGEAPE